MTLLLVSLGISGKRGQGESEVSESERIPNRAGRIGILREEENEALAICPKHRKHLTTNYRLIKGRRGDLVSLDVLM